MSDGTGRGAREGVLTKMSLGTSYECAAIPRAGGSAQRQADGEAGAAAGGAVYGDRAAEQRTQAAAERQAEAGAAGAAGEARIGLAVGLEQLGALLLGHADAGVGDGELEPGDAGGVGLAGGGDRDRAGVGELGGDAD